MDEQVIVLTQDELIELAKMIADKSASWVRVGKTLASNTNSMYVNGRLWDYTVSVIPAPDSTHARRQRHERARTLAHDEQVHERIATMPNRYFDELVIDNFRECRVAVADSVITPGAIHLNVGAAVFSDPHKAREYANAILRAADALTQARKALGEGE